MTDTMTAVLDQEEATAVKAPVSTQPPSPKNLHPFSQEQEVPRADKTMILALVCAAAFSVCLVVFVLFPVLQTLVSTTSSSWNPGP